MIVRRHKSSHIAAAIAVVAFVGLGLGMPIVVGNSGQLQGTLVAAPRDRYAITEPLTLRGLPGVKIERGLVSLSDDYNNKVMTGEAVAALLEGGSARLSLEGATIVIDRNVGARQEDTQLDDAAPLAVALADANFDTLSVRRSTLVFIGEDGSRGMVGEANFEVVLKRKSALNAKGTLTVRGHKLTLDAAMGLLTAG